MGGDNTLDIDQGQLAAQSAVTGAQAGRLMPMTIPTIPAGKTPLDGAAAAAGGTMAAKAAKLAAASVKSGTKLATALIESPANLAAQDSEGAGKYAKPAAQAPSTWTI